MKKIFISLICLFMMFLAPPTLVFADNNYGSIAVSFEYNEEYVEGVKFNLYQVATYDEEKNLILNEKFKNYSLVAADLEDENLESLIEKLSLYVDSEKIEEDESKVSIKTGLFSFTDLENGVYLIVGENLETDEGVFIAQPILVKIPTIINEEEIHGVIVNPKCDFRKWIEELKVIKKWDDKNNPNRPKEIVIELLKEGKLYDEVLLNEENNWSYTWEHLISYDYKVVEKDVPKGYSSSIDYNDYTFVVTNTYKRETGLLPATGQQWMAVFILLIGGSLLIICGLKKKEKKN